MATQPTNLPVPSESPRDLKFNAGKIDEFVTSLALQYIDRFGNPHYTIEGLRWLAQQAIAQFGWILIDSFQDGADITIPNQALRDEDTGEYYRWDGALPKHVDAGSTPDTSGGVGVGAWVGIGDASLRAMLATVAGAGMIGTAHRGTLASDLNAIDRRPDGYGNSIPAVLANGLDVQIGKDMSITVPVAVLSNQHIEGAGGNISQTTSTAAGVRVESADASNTKNYVTINNLRTTGSTVTTEPGNEGYALFLRNTKYNRISGVLADKYTGGVVAGSSKSLIVRDVITHDTTFHPFSSSTRDGRGGYGVITDNISDSIIDGIVHDVGAVDDGRHILYVSTGGYGNTSGNRNFIAANLIGKYLGKDDRNFWGVNVRKSTIFVIGQTVIDGANGGVAFNAENGDITDFIVHGQQLDIIKYQDGIGVYGISLPKDAANVGARFLVSNFNIRVRPKNTSLTGADCVAISVGYQNGMITNGLTNVPAGSSPILINDGATNTTFSNIHDTILPGYTGSTVAMFAFTGSAVSNITVKNITTTRPMFTRLSVVTDLTVDFQRKARISTNGSGGSSKIDSNEIISTVSLTSSAITVNFPTHVTQNAIENVYVAGTAGAYQVFITSIGAKAITISLYTPAGALINPLTSSASFNVILSS
ncbi:tail fiber/spike domain-containing protein [Enterobacter huaxiensis]|uniref:tail fiber/spike domain-containing protein n=1 Tax=Enterobacter huaxiensis TaxID=2494702 RepID=UPI001F3BD728|nr:hypothetical protein [Enterobacter huaxiensis]